MKTRKIISLILGISFILSSITGIVLYFVPKGKNAFWSAWHFFSLTKQQWANLHITLSLLLLIVGIWHTVLNWNCVLNYLKNHLKKVSLFNRQFLLALAINAVFVLGTIFMIPPLGTIIQIKTRIEQSWKHTLGEPPFGHAEEKSLNYFINRNGANKELILNRLKTNGITVTDVNASLQKIAHDNNISPQKIYRTLDFRQNRSRLKRPTQLGRKTLQELADQGYFHLQKAISLLKAKGINVTPQMRIKTIADDLGMTPIETFEFISR